MAGIENPYQATVIQTGLRGLKIPWAKARAGSTPASGILFFYVFRFYSCKFSFTYFKNKLFA